MLAAPKANAGTKGRFDGKVVLITGATSGIGRETALAFAAQGARVGFCGRRAELGREVHGRGFYVKADARESGQVKSFVDEVVRRYGKLDIAVNNAGIHFAKPVHETGLDEWEDIQRTNARGVFLAIEYEIPHLARERRRHHLHRLVASRAHPATPAPRTRGSSAHPASPTTNGPGVR